MRYERAKQAGGRVKPHWIEAESFRILAERVDLSGRDELHARILARVVHATADTGYIDTIMFDAGAADAGIQALRSKAPVICDTKMVSAGITNLEAHCFLDQAMQPAGRYATRSAAGMRLAAERYPAGAIVVVGCAPTALEEVVRLAEQEAFAPQLVIGMPVGFVGAAEAKERARNCERLTTITNTGEKGGSAAAAAVLNALTRIASSRDTSPTSAARVPLIGRGDDLAARERKGPHA